MTGHALRVSFFCFSLQNKNANQGTSRVLMDRACAILKMNRFGFVSRVSLWRLVGGWGVPTKTEFLEAPQFCSPQQE